MSNEKNLISLKEAAKISGYSADYIGQLIRSGKIPGKQVYCNVQWMTTEQSVLDYKTNNQEKNNKKVTNKFRLFKMQLDVIGLFFKTFKYSLPILTVIFISFLLLSFYLFYIFTPGPITTDTILNSENNSQNVTF